MGNVVISSVFTFPFIFLFPLSFTFIATVSSISFLPLSGRRPEKRKCREKLMSGTLEVYLWLVIGKSIRNYSGNSHTVPADQIMMSHRLWHNRLTLKCKYRMLVQKGYFPSGMVLILVNKEKIEVIQFVLYPSSKLSIVIVDIKIQV